MLEDNDETILILDRKTFEVDHPKIINVTKLVTIIIHAHIILLIVNYGTLIKNY